MLERITDPRHASYFEYIRRHHFYHHSARGRDLAFGLTSGIWDVPLGTRIPAEERERLHGRRPSRSERVAA